MSIALLIAAVLSVWLGVLHSVLGERILLRPLIATDPVPAAIGTHHRRQVMRLAWHATSITWIGIGLVFLVLAIQPLDGPALAVLAVLAATFAAMLVMSLAWTRGRHGSWMFCLAIALAAAWPLVQWFVG